MTLDQINALAVVFGVIAVLVAIMLYSGDGAPPNERG